MAASKRETAFAAIGFGVAALPIAVLFALTSPGLGGGIHGDPVTILALTSLFYVYSIVFTLLFGGPLFLVLRRFRLIRWWTSGLAGLAVGAAVAEIIVPGAAPVHERAKFVLMCAATGGLSAIAFWLIWRRGVPTVGAHPKTES